MNNKGVVVICHDSTVAELELTMLVNKATAEAVATVIKFGKYEFTIRRWADLILF